jgi:hypothetical protein
MGPEKSTLSRELRYMVGQFEGFVIVVQKTATLHRYIGWRYIESQLYQKIPTNLTPIYKKITCLRLKFNLQLNYFLTHIQFYFPKLILFDLFQNICTFLRSISFY